jgi:hypothetical protein
VHHVRVGVRGDEKDGQSPSIALVRIGEQRTGKQKKGETRSASPFPFHSLVLLEADPGRDLHVSWTRSLRRLQRGDRPEPRLIDLHIRYVKVTMIQRVGRLRAFTLLMPSMVNDMSAGVVPAITRFELSSTCTPGSVVSVNSALVDPFDRE